MTHYLRNGNAWRVTDEKSMDLHSKLPPGNYTVKADPFGNLFLEQIDSFVPLKKYYGETLKHTDRIMNTFLERDASTGIVLNGEKGSGKTLLAKHLSITGAEMGIPTIIINSPWRGDSFNQLIQDIEQPCIVLFDEFEKVYDRENQEEMLTLLDGVFPSKKLFVLTCNDKWRIDHHMRNRPGRIFYMIDFTGLSPTFIKDYCEDNLKNKGHIESVLQVTAIFSQFNFDMLKALVEDMNRYNESPQDAMKLLNAKPEYENTNAHTQYDMKLWINDAPVEDEYMVHTTWAGNPVMHDIEADYYVGTATPAKRRDGTPAPGLDLSKCEYVELCFTNHDLKHVNGTTGTFVYVNEEENAKLQLTRSKVRVFNVFDAF